MRGTERKRVSRQYIKGTLVLLGSIAALLAVLALITVLLRLIGG